MGLAQKMAEVDALIFGALGETALFGSREVNGIFNKRFREIVLEDGTLVGLTLSFDCQHESFMDTLAVGDPVVIEGKTYLYQRALVPGGDETGLVIMELATDI